MMMMMMTFYFQLTYLGKDCIEIPKILIKLYASSAKRADFTFCSLQSLKGLESFSCLQELILDNNNLTDDTTFPSIFTLRILSMNKNRVSMHASSLPHFYLSSSLSFLYPLPFLFSLSSFFSFSFLSLSSFLTLTFFFN